ncbi:MAG: hypothetical protein KJ645_13875, partial [Planctomycetes bacterium]|nr:hypothetical protein [Planctomycetota bacterium]
IQDGRTGLLVKPDDADSLVTAVERLFDSRDLANRMGAAARTKVEDDFDWKITAETLTKIVAG